MRVLTTSRCRVTHTLRRQTVYDSIAFGDMGPTLVVAGRESPGKSSRCDFANFAARSLSTRRPVRTFRVTPRLEMDGFVLPIGCCEGSYVRICVSSHLSRRADLMHLWHFVRSFRTSLKGKLDDRLGCATQPSAGI